MGKGTEIVDYWKEKMYCRKAGPQTRDSHFPLILSLSTLQAKLCLQNSYPESLVPSASECSGICYRSGGVKRQLLGCVWVSTLKLERRLLQGKICEKDKEEVLGRR